MLNVVGHRTVTGLFNVTVIQAWNKTSKQRQDVVLTAEELQDDAETAAGMNNGRARREDVCGDLPLASGARPVRRAVILPWEVQRTIVSSAKVRAMRDMLPAGKIIRIPIQSKWRDS